MLLTITWPMLCARTSCSAGGSATNASILPSTKSSIGPRDRLILAKHREGITQEVIGADLGVSPPPAEGRRAQADGDVDVSCAVDRSKPNRHALPAIRVDQGAAMDVADWLQNLGLEQYQVAFRENGVSVDTLPHLTVEDLRELGVAAVGHRRQLLVAIAKLRDDGLPVQAEE